jgi:hypothetical protein
VVIENERLCLPINHNILSASPYLIVRTVHWVKKPAYPLPLPLPNMHHHTKCDPAANICATNNINILCNSVELDHPFLITSADCTVPAMSASICGTFVIQILDGYTCNIPLQICPSLADTIVSTQHFTSPAIQDRHYNYYCLTVSLTCRVSVALSCHISMTMMHPSLPSRRATP